jgi:hypothetical protein
MINLKKINFKFPKKWSKKKKMLVLIGGIIVILALVGAAFYFFVGNKNPSATSNKETSVATDLSTKPGTYLTIKTDPGQISGISGLEKCKKQTTVDSVLTCQLSDDTTSFTLKAPLNATKDGKKYVFQSWQGCTTSVVAEGSCTISVTKGTNLLVKATYSIEVSPQGSAPFVELKVANVANRNSNNFAFELPAPDGQSSVTTTMQLSTGGVKISDCTIVDSIVLDGVPSTPQTTNYTPLASQSVSLVDGVHTITATCSSSSKKIFTILTVHVKDRQPKLCKNYSFTDSASTTATLEELQSGIVGTWQGCVTTPWTPAYWVTVTFKNDGTYTAFSSEILDGQSMVPMYYGGQQNSSKDTYAIDTLQNGLGTGRFNIVFTDGSGSVVDEDMQLIKLMGNKLSFRFKHFNQYGPLTYQLNRQ